MQYFWINLNSVHSLVQWLESKIILGTTDYNDTLYFSYFAMENGEIYSFKSL